MKSKVLVILGLTATGKTDIALYLAKKFNGELVACDSRQVYRGLDIGTGKFPNGRWKLEDGKWEKGKDFWEITGTKIWMYDAISSKIQYTVANYIKEAKGKLEDISKRGKLPIVVGGTGLYLKGLLEGLSNLNIPVNKNLRKELSKLSLSSLQQKIKKLSLIKWDQLNNSDRNNPRRLIRAIELVLMYSKPSNDITNAKEKNLDLLKLGLTAPREILYEKINKRVFRWLADGIVDEVKNLRKKGVSKKRFKELGLEYGVIIEYLDGEVEYEEMIEKMQTKVRHYAKRQLVWFKKMNNIVWFDISDKGYLQKVENLTIKWYHQF